MNREAVKRLFSYMKSYKLYMSIVVISILISSAASVASSVFIQVLIDDYIVPVLAMDNPVFSGLLKALFVMGVIYLAGVFTAWLYNFLMVRIAQGVLKEIRDNMFEKMQFLPVRYFDTHTHGDIMSHFTNDADTLRQMLAQSLPQTISSVFTITAIFCCMLYQSVYLTAIVLLCTFLMMKFAKPVVDKSGFFFMKQQEALGVVNGYVEEMIHGQKVVKVFCHEEKNIEEFKIRNRQWKEASAKANGYANSMMPMMNAFGYMQYVIIAVAGGFLAIRGTANLTILGMNTLTLGTIASFLTLSRNFTNPISQIANQLNSIIMAVAGAERIFTLMDEESEIDTGSFGCEGLSGNIVLKDVTFGYTKEKTVLSDINVYAKEGQKVAFVGATGAGKTTITNLINRFYDVDEGNIYYDGVNIKDIGKFSLRSSIGVVLQDVNLFTATVMENIRYGKKTADDEECIAAAKLANAHEFIMMLPHGYQTVLEGAGEGLSQGQKQLLSIARTAVSDPKVMILDEATSSIDSRTEALVQNAMDKLMEGRTVFVIAHRLSTIQNADVIMVLEHGKITERGSHQELMDKRGIYYSLYSGLFELE
ncbi:MAG: ABC transporter ATP-binding protein [Anaerovoracaceae bacterium]